MIIQRTKIYIVTAVVLLLAVAAGAYYVFLSNRSEQGPGTEMTDAAGDAIPIVYFDQDGNRIEGELPGPAELPFTEEEFGPQVDLSQPDYVTEDGVPVFLVDTATGTMPEFTGWEENATSSMNQATGTDSFPIGEPDFDPENFPELSDEELSALRSIYDEQPQSETEDGVPIYIQTEAVPGTVILESNDE